MKYLLNCAPDSYGSPEGETVVKTPTYSVPSSNYAAPAAPPPPTGYETAAAADDGGGSPKPESKPTPGPIYYKPVETGHDHEAGTYLYKPVESEAKAVAAPTTSYVSSSISVAGLCHCIEWNLGTKIDKDCAIGRTIIHGHEEAFKEHRKYLV